MVSSCWGNRCICFISTSSQAACVFTQSFFHCLRSSLAPCPADDHGVHGYPGASSLGPGPPLLIPVLPQKTSMFQDLPVSSKYKDNKPSLKNESILRIKRDLPEAKISSAIRISSFGPWNYSFYQIVFITVLSIVLSHSFYHIATREHWDNHFSGILIEKRRSTYHTSTCSYWVVNDIYSWNS